MRHGAVLHRCAAAVPRRKTGVFFALPFLLCIADRVGAHRAFHGVDRCQAAAMVKTLAVDLVFFFCMYQYLVGRGNLRRCFDLYQVAAALCIVYIILRSRAPFCITASAGARASIRTMWRCSCLLRTPWDCICSCRQSACAITALRSCFCSSRSLPVRAKACSALWSLRSAMCFGAIGKTVSATCSCCWPRALFPRSPCSTSRCCMRTWASGWCLP